MPLENGALWSMKFSQDDWKFMRASVHTDVLTYIDGDGGEMEIGLD